MTLRFELRDKGDACELSGGKLDGPLLYPQPNAIEHASRMVSFLSQVEGAELRVYDAEGTLTETRNYREGVRPSKGELGNV